MPDGNKKLERGCPEVHVSASSTQQRTACFVQLHLSRHVSTITWRNRDFQGRAEGQSWSQRLSRSLTSLINHRLKPW